MERQEAVLVQEGRELLRWGTRRDRDQHRGCDGDRDRAAAAGQEAQLLLPGAGPGPLLRAPLPRPVSEAEAAGRRGPVLSHQKLQQPPLTWASGQKENPHQRAHAGQVPLPAAVGPGLQVALHQAAHRTPEPQAGRVGRRRPRGARAWRQAAAAHQGHG